MVASEVVWDVASMRDQVAGRVRAAAPTCRPRPKTAWLAKLRRQFFSGVGVRDDARPAPIAGCIRNSSTAAMARPQVTAGSKVGRLSQAAGLSLDEIQSMLSPHRGPEIDRKPLAAKADEIDTQVRQMRAMSRGLRHAAALLVAGGAAGQGRRHHRLDREDRRVHHGGPHRHAAGDSRDGAAASRSERGRPVTNSRVRVSSRSRYGRPTRH